MATSKTERILMGILSRIFHSGITVLFTFIGIVTLLSIFNSNFLFELFIGLVYVIIPIASIIAIIYICRFFINRRRVNSGLLPLRDLNLFGIFWNGINHNSLTMTVTILVLVLIVGYFNSELWVEARNSFFIFINEIIKPLIRPLITIILLCVIFWVAFRKILGLGGKSKH